MRTWPVLLVGMLGLAATLSGCSKREDPWAKVPGKGPRVLVSFPPLYCFAKNVAGDDAQVRSLLTTRGPHDHQPTAEDAIIARRADVFLVNGLGLDDFTASVVNNSGNPNPHLVRKVGETIPTGTLIPIDKNHKHAGGKCDCAHGEHDPHVWLGIDEAVLMTDQICKILQELNPTRKNAYRERADAYIARLHKLKEYGRDKLASKKNRSFITNHNSFEYFRRSFGLVVEGAIQVQPGIEADAVRIVKLGDLARAKGIRVIGVEPQYSRAAAETLQERLRRDVPDMTIIELDPIETSPWDLRPDYYEQQMKTNLDNLAKALS